MADNITLDSMSGGSVVATDDIGGVHYQIIKLAYGALDAQTIVSTSNGLPVSLLAGSASIGILGSNSGVDIGDVTINNASGGSAVNIQDGGNSITVDNAVLTVMNDWDNGASDGASVSGDVAHDTADAGEPVKMGGKAQSHLSDPAEVSAANDRVNALFDRVGRLAVYQGYVLKSAVINHSTSGDNTLVSAVATKRIRVLAIVISSDGTTDVRFESGASGTALTGQVPLQVREGYTVSNPWGLFETTAVNTLLNLELTAAVNVHGFISYIEVDD